MYKFLIFAMGIVLFPTSALCQKDTDRISITNSLSVSYSYLPIEYPSNTYEADGVGLNYELSVSPMNSRFLFMTGAGISYYLHKKDYDKRIPLLTTDYYTYTHHAIEYVYLSFPIKLGFKLVDKGDFTLVPYFGLSFKYNLSYIQKYSFDSNTYSNTFIDIYNDDLYECDARRTILQYDMGLELGYKHFYATVNYKEDDESLYSTLMYRYVLSVKGLYAPEKFHMWSIGAGFRF